MAYNEDIIVHSTGEIECVLCHTVILVNENKSILSHINDKSHEAMYRKRLMVRNNIVYSNGSILCLICKDVINEPADIETHVNSSPHRSLITSLKNVVQKDGDFLELPIEITDRGSDIHCLICDEPVSLTLEDIKCHIDSATHKRARSIIIQPFHGIFSVKESDDDLWCKICQVYIQNYVEIILEHVDEDVEHVQKHSELHELIKNEYITIEKYLTIGSEDKATCKKCDIKVPCSVDNIKAHINGKKHKN